MTVNSPPSIKQYQEAIVAYLLLQHAGLLEELLLPQLASVEKGNTATGSQILIAVQVALNSPPEAQAHSLPVLVKQLLPWTNHHTHNIRTFAQLGFCAIMDAKPLDTWGGWREGLGPGGAEVLGELLRFMHDNMDFQRFRRAMVRTSSSPSIGTGHPCCSTAEQLACCDSRGGVMLSEFACACLTT